MRKSYLTGVWAGIAVAMLKGNYAMYGILAGSRAEEDIVAAGTPVSK